MLCDSIIEWSLNHKNILPKEIFNAYSILGEKLKNAQRFVLNRDAVMTINSIAESTPKRFEQALSVCRLPYPSLWIEFSFKDRLDWMTEAVNRGLVIEKHEDSSPPSRLGLYIEQINKNEIMIIPCWSHPNFNLVSICHMALRINIDPNDDVSIPPDLRQEIIQKINNLGSKSSLLNKWMNNKEEIEYGYKLESRISEYIPYFMRPIWDAIPAGSNYDKLLDLSRYDLKSEWRFALSFLTVINSRNVISIGPETDMVKLNKSRLKKNITPLMSYREIRLNISKIQRNRLGEAYSSRDLQAHLVRGHWKLRKSGLFWWNPFVRGSIGEASSTTTIIKG